MTRVGHGRADPPTATAEPLRRLTERTASPDLRTLTPDSILALQRSAGNRAVGRRLQRKPTVLERSVGEDFAQQLTPDELRQQVALVVDELAKTTLDPTTRMVLEQNLQELEDYASTNKIDLPASTYHHLRQIIDALANDIKVIATGAKGLTPDGPFGDRDPDLNWSVDRLKWLTDTVLDAAARVEEAVKAGPRSAPKFATVAKLVTAAIPVSKAVAAHLAYLKVVRKVEEHFPNSWSSMMYTKLAVVREAFTPLISKIQGFDPTHFDTAVAELLKEVPSFSFDFSQFVDDLEEKMKKRHRFRQWVGIFELALLAFDIWLLPVTGRPGGGGRGKPPTIGGASGGTAVAGGGVLVAAESIEALGGWCGSVW